MASSYNNGKIYCKVRREASTVVMQNEFNLAGEDFYFLLAIGSSYGGSTISKHDLNQWSSDEAIALPRSGSTSFAMSAPMLTIAMWMLVSCCIQFLHGL